MTKPDAMLAFAATCSIRTTRKADGWHGVVVFKADGKTFCDPRPFPTESGAVLATRAVAFAKFKAA